MAKAAEKEVQKGNYRCSNCNVEFTGTACPECGNAKDNVRLASDMIDQGLHGKEYIFKGLKSAEGTEADLMQMKAAQAQVREFEDNMREAYVARSELKKHEAEIQKLRKEAELAEAKANLAAGKSVSTNPAPAQPGAGYPLDNGYTPFMGMNPQTAFMSKLMKMNKDERQEFLSQLSEADPQALANMSAMLAPATPMMPPGYGGMPGMQSMAGVPPWMQQMYMQQMMMQQSQHQQQQQPQADPMETAMNIVSMMFEMMNKSKPAQDDSFKETLREIREENKDLRRRLDERAAGGNTDALKPVLEEVTSLRNQLANNIPRRTIADSISEVKSLVTGLEEIGMLNRPGALNKTVDDEIKLKQLEHNIAKDTKQQELEEKKIDAEKAKAAMAQNMMAAMFQRGLVKRQQGADGAAPVKRVDTRTAPSAAHSVPPQPAEVIEVHESDAGRVIESRAPIRKQEIM